MNRTHSRRSHAGAVLTLALAACAFAAPLGCKPVKKSAPAAAAPSGSAAAPVATGPCADYAAKICEKAGKESATCESFKSSTDLMSPAACSAGLKDIKVSLGKLTAQRSSCEELVKTLCAAVGEQTQTCGMVRTQTAQFPPDRCKQMQQHTAEIIADLKKRETANQPLSAELRNAIADDTAPSFGPADAKVTVVEFSDFECPYCSKAADVMTQLKDKYGQRVRFVFRQFPLSFHANARGAAEAALAAHAQGKFWQYHDRLFKNQSALDRASLENHAKEAGINLAQFKKSLDDKTFASRIDSDMKLGERVAVQGTPTLFVNGERVGNPTDFAAVALVIEKALSGGSPPG